MGTSRREGPGINLSGPLDYIAGGWELGGVYNYRTGLPIQLLITRNDIVYRDRRNGKIYGTPVIVDGVVQTDALVNSPGGGASRQFRRPDVVAGVNPFIVGGDRLAYLNPAAFAVPAPGTYGNLGRNALAGPDLAQMDLTLHKRLPITERVNVEFRAEIYNLLNRANFANPPATLGVGLPNGYTATSGAEPNPAGVQPGQSFTASAAGGAFGRFNSTVANTVGLARGAAAEIQLSHKSWIFRRLTARLGSKLSSTIILRPAEAEVGTGDAAVGLDKRDGLESGALHRSEAEIHQLHPHRVFHRQQGPEGKLVEAFEHLEGARGAGRVDGR